MVEALEVHDVPGDDRQPTDQPCGADQRISEGCGIGNVKRTGSQHCLDIGFLFVASPPFALRFIRFPTVWS